VTHHKVLVLECERHDCKAVLMVEFKEEHWSMQPYADAMNQGWYIEADGVFCPTHDVSLFVDGTAT
jgi:hypothetical protein